MYLAFLFIIGFASDHLLKHSKHTTTWWKSSMVNCKNLRYLIIIIEIGTLSSSLFDFNFNSFWQTSQALCIVPQYRFKLKVSKKIDRHILLTLSLSRNISKKLLINNFDYAFMYFSISGFLCLSRLTVSFILRGKLLTSYLLSVFRFASFEGVVKHKNTSISKMKCLVFFPFTTYFLFSSNSLT